MVTLLAATAADPASIGPASSLLAMPGWHPGPTVQGMPSFVNEKVRLLKLENHLVREDHLDKRWEEATGEMVDEVIFLSRHVAASNRPALTIHPIGTPHLRQDEVPLAGGRPGWAAPPNCRIGPWLRLLRNIAESHKLVPEFEVTLEATHHGPEISSPAMFVEIGSTEEYWKRQDAAQAIALLVWEGLGLGGGNSVGDWSSKGDRPKVLLGIGGGHYVPRHMDIVWKDGVWVGHLLSGYSLPMEEPSASKEVKSKGVAGTWREAIKIAFETTRLGFPGGEVLAHLDLKYRPTIDPAWPFNKLVIFHRHFAHVPILRIHEGRYLKAIDDTIRVQVACLRHDSEIQKCCHHWEFWKLESAAKFSLCGISELTTEHGVLRNMCEMDCVSKFIRHHITHWASCFRAFGMHSEDQTGTYSPSIPPLAIRNARIDSNNRNTDDAISRKFSRSRRTNKGTIPTPKRVSNKIRTSFAEKDFIVFSIKEDGTFDIAKDGSSQTSVCQDDRRLRSLRSVSIELKSRGEQKASVQECNEETSTGGSPVLISDDEDDKEESMCLGEDSHSGSAGMGFRMEGNRDCTQASTESRDSGQSDGSTDSFTFPVLHGQWIGSPVKMPRSEDLSLRKPTASCVRFKCCKF